jgi:acyl carrier protein
MLGLEDKFEIEVPDEYLQAEHYESIVSIMKIVESAR